MGELIPFWHDSEDRDRGEEPDYYLTEEELGEDTYCIMELDRG